MLEYTLSTHKLKHLDGWAGRTTIFGCHKVSPFCRGHPVDFTVNGICATTDAAVEPQCATIHTCEMLDALPSSQPSLCHSICHCATIHPASSPLRLRRSHHQHALPPKQHSNKSSPPPSLRLRRSHPSQHSVTTLRHNTEISQPPEITSGCATILASKVASKASLQVRR